MTVYNTAILAFSHFFFCIVTQAEVDKMSQFTIHTDFRIRHLILINASIRRGRVSMAVAGFTFMHMPCSLWVEGMGSAVKTFLEWAPGSLSMKWGEILLEAWANIKTVCREHGQLSHSLSERSTASWAAADGLAAPRAEGPHTYHCCQGLRSCVGRKQSTLKRTPRTFHRPFKASLGGHLHRAHCQY